MACHGRTVVMASRLPERAPSARAPSARQSSRRAAVVHLGQWTQLLRDAEYGRLPKVLDTLRGMAAEEINAVASNVIVRGIERCTPNKLLNLLDIIRVVGERSSAIQNGSRATLGGTTTYPLVRAAYHGLLPVVQALLAHGASVEAVAGHSASTMESTLSAAVRTNQLTTLKALLEAIPPLAQGGATPKTRGLVAQALWQAFEKNNVAACHLLLAHGGARVDDVFASMLVVLEQAKKFLRFAQAAGATSPLVAGRPRPWHLPPAYVRGAVTLTLCVRRCVATFPAELLDHILSLLPRDPTLFVDTATLQANLPRRDYTASSSKFAILARRRHRNGELLAEDEDGAAQW